MVVQSKKAHAILFFFSVVFVLGLGIVGFVILRDRSIVSAEEGRYYGEILLYLSLLFSIIIAVMYSFIFFRNKNILKELDKIIEMSLYSNFSPEQSLKRLSTIGEKIGQLYKNVNAVSEKRALKISSLHGLNTFLLDNVSLPLVITDVRGVVTAASKDFRDRYPKQAELASGSIITFLPDLKMQNVLDEFDENYTSVQFKQGRMDITIYPIRNYEYEVAYLVFVIGKGNLVQDEVLRKTIGDRPREKKPRGLLNKLFGRRDRK